MQIDFHYYATYAAAFIAGYSHEEALSIAYSAQFVDCCTRTFLSKVKGPLAAATTQSQLELAEARTDILGLQEITRIWASFHFLPYDLYAKKKFCGKRYLDKYRLICNTNSDLLVKTVQLAAGSDLQSIGIAMHILADTWAHRYFAGTPSLVINNINYYFYELLPSGEFFKPRKITFRHSPNKSDDLVEGLYTNTVFQSNEHSVMNLGHGRAGHLPDYSFARYKYLPAWGDYDVIVKDNPTDYLHAFCQMIYALKFLRGEHSAFLKDTYDVNVITPWFDEIKEILTIRQKDASGDWLAFCESLSGNLIEPFSLEKYQEEYIQASKQEKDHTFLGRFFLGALAQKSMVTHEIFSSGNHLAGFSVDYLKSGIKGIRDYQKLVQRKLENL